MEHDEERVAVRGHGVRRRPRRPSLGERIMSGITPVTAIALALVLVQLVVRGWVVTRSYYFQDDFAHLDLARRLGLSSDYLVRDYGGHLEVGQYALIWVVSHFVDGSFAPAAISILALQGVASLLLLLLLRTLFGDSPLVLLPFSIYLFTPLAVGWSSWWSAALQTLPMQIATILVLLTTAQAWRKRSVWWGAASVLAFAAGLAMWEKAGLILPLALAVNLLVVASPASWRQRLVGLRRTAWMWLAHAAVLAAYAYLYLSVVGGGLERDGGEAVSVGEVLDKALLRTFVPGLFGGPWHGEGADSTIFPYTETFPAVIFLLALLGLVVLSFLVTGRRAIEGWLLLAGYLAADLALLGLGRADWAGFLAQDPRYVADALPVIPIALLAAFRGLLEPAGHGPRPVAAWLRPRTTRAMVLRGTALVLISCLVTTARMAPSVTHEYSSNYTLGVSRQMEAQPDRSVVNGAPPYEISARADLAGMMNAIGSEVTFDRPATEMYLFDGLAQMWPVDLFPGTEVETGPVEGCGWSVRSYERRLGEVEADGSAPRVLRLGFYAGEAVDLRVSVAGKDQKLRLDAGLGRAFFVIGPEAGALTVSAVGDEALCVTDFGVGYAWVAQSENPPG